MRFSSRLDIYWSKLESNWNVVRGLAPKAQILPMVKANAYGHGLVSVSKFLGNELSARALGVATVGEAEELHSEYPEFRHPIYVFSDTSLEDTRTHALYTTKKILPVIHEMSQLKVFLTPTFKSLPLILKLNTGMNRLGISEEEWEEAIKLIKASGRTSIEHLLSHFALTFHEIKAGDKSHRQVELFEKGKRAFRDAGLQIQETSLANSGAIEQKFAVNETWVRPGLMLYGPPSFETKTQLISSLVTKVIKVFPAKRGVPVGYGINVLPEDGVIAIIPLGYGDGFSTQSAGFFFDVKGFRAKVFGRVNMDMAFLFFPMDALDKIKVGDEIRLWNGDPKPLVDWADHMNTHAYQAMCGISSRIPRSYHLE